MENNELKNSIKNRTCYYIDDMIKSTILILIIFYWMKSYTGIS